MAANAEWSVLILLQHWWEEWKPQDLLCKDEHKNDRNGMDLTEAEDIKKRWKEYTEELYKKDLYDPDNHDGVTTHLEPDILECDIKWALGSITRTKLVEVMEFQLSYFKS